MSKKKIVIKKKKSSTSKNSSQHSALPSIELPISSESAGDLSLPKSASDAVVQVSIPHSAPIAGQSVPFDQIARSVNPPQEHKRGPGRPKKETATSASASPQNSASSAFSAAGGTSPSTGAPPALTVQSSGIPHPIIRNGLEMPFAMAAAQTGFAGFALTRDESDPLVPMADMLMGKWLPTIGPYGIELMFCGSIASLAFVKYMTFLDFKKERDKKNVSRVAGDASLSKGQ